MPAVTKRSTKVRRAREKQRRRAEILDAAERVFHEKGYRPATTDDLAGAAGVSVGTVYNFFGSKEGLYAEVLRRIARELLARVKQDILTKGDPEEAIERLIEYHAAN